MDRQSVSQCAYPESRPWAPSQTGRKKQTLRQPPSRGESCVLAVQGQHTTQMLVRGQQKTIFPFCPQDRGGWVPHIRAPKRKRRSAAKLFSHSCGPACAACCADSVTTTTAHDSPHVTIGRLRISGCCPDVCSSSARRQFFLSLFHSLTTRIVLNLISMAPQKVFVPSGTPGQAKIHVDDFIANNFTPYDGDGSFLAGLFSLWALVPVYFESVFLSSSPLWNAGAHCSGHCLHRCAAAVPNLGALQQCTAAVSQARGQSCAVCMHHACTSRHTLRLCYCCPRPCPGQHALHAPSGDMIVTTLPRWRWGGGGSWARRL